MNDTMRKYSRHSLGHVALRRKLGKTLAIGGSAAVVAVAPSTMAATYEVGPGKPYAALKDVASRLVPGDVVEVQGGTTYAGGLVLDAAGTAASKITIRGIRVNGARPILSGGTNTVEFRADHYVFEGFEITQGSSRCVFHHANDITLRDSVIHDCPGQGLLGADADSGSLTMAYVEVYACGTGDKSHQIYMATDETAHPGSVFRMEHCYVHDGNGGNNVKSRAERNEIYYNWIEGAYYRELELIGPDGQDPGLAREDSDVVGNVLHRTRGSYVARLGGDGTGDTGGRYRFVNNTILAADGSSPIFQMFDSIESVEMHNNVFYGGKAIYTDSDASWVSGKAVITGSNNWIQSGASAIPADFTGTITGSDPGFTNLAGWDLRPTAGSPLVDKGTPHPMSPAAYPFTSPLAAPVELPPAHKVEADGTGLARPTVETIDIGAYEYGTGTNPPPNTTPDPGANAGGASNVPPAAGSGGAGSGGAPPDTTPPGSSGGSAGDPTAGSPPPPPATTGTTPPTTTGEPSSPPPASTTTGSPATTGSSRDGATSDASSCDVAAVGRRSAPLAWLFAALSLAGIASEVRRRAARLIARRRE